MSSSQSKRIAFYPCCASDIEEPRRLLQGLVDEIIFCDLRSPSESSLIDIDGAKPAATFWQADVRSIIQNLPPISVLFYRRDGCAEGGSGVRILSKPFMRRILQRFDPAGGWIFSDGSNGGNGIFRKMSRGYSSTALGFEFSPDSDRFDWTQGSLRAIRVTPLSSTSTTSRSG